LAEVTLQTIRVAQKRGSPKTRPQELVADKAYDSIDFRRKLRRRSIKPTIPTYERRRRNRPERGRSFRPGAVYRQRWRVERCLGCTGNCRRLVVRYDRHPHLYKAFCLVAIILWCIDRILK
jgi:transposase